jgi:hypothetical protein
MGLIPISTIERALRSVPSTIVQRPSEADLGGGGPLAATRLAFKLFRVIADRGPSGVICDESFRFGDGTGNADVRVIGH